jgi:hypothetical protein
MHWCVDSTEQAYKPTIRIIVISSYPVSSSLACCVVLSDRRSVQICTVRVFCFEPTNLNTLPHEPILLHHSIRGLSILKRFNLLHLALHTTTTLLSN